MATSKNKFSRGFTTLELTIAVGVAAIIGAISTPKLINAMREYRTSLAVRQLSDMIQRAKVQATSENHSVALRIDPTNRKAGLVVYDTNNNEVRCDYVTLPQGVNFVLPSGVTAPVTGAPTDRTVTFALKAGSTTIYEQMFNSRGFPTVAAGSINAIYVGSNNQTYRALTLNSVGGMRTWKWQSDQWVDTRHTS